MNIEQATGCIHELQNMVEGIKKDLYLIFKRLAKVERKVGIDIK